MRLEVRFTEEAEKDLQDIVMYIREVWNEKVVDEFISDIDEQIDRIAEMPYLFQKTEKRENVRKCLINKRVALFYKVTENMVFLLSFRSTLQNPESSLY
jgi:plasmid stabilization system protein ParE